jgi:hypothetical protein
VLRNSKLKNVALFVGQWIAPLSSALVSATAEMKCLNGFSLAATFEGEFSGNVSSYSGKGVLRYAR